MVLIKWDKSLLVGVKEIDEQHKHLVDLINQLNDSIKVGQAKDTVQTILKGMAEYTVTHFGFEEKYFDEFGFEGADEHKKQHKVFVDRVSSFQKDVESFNASFEEGNLYVAKEVMEFLKDWFVNHIKVTDQKYVECFREHGLT